MFYTVISHERAPVNALRPNGLRTLNNGPLVANHCIKHPKPFVIPILKVYHRYKFTLNSVWQEMLVAILIGAYDIKNIFNAIKIC